MITGAPPDYVSTMITGAPPDYLSTMITGAPPDYLSTMIMLLASRLRLIKERQPQLASGEDVLANEFCLVETILLRDIVKMGMRFWLASAGKPIKLLDDLFDGSAGVEAASGGKRVAKPFFYGSLAMGLGDERSDLDVSILPGEKMNEEVHSLFANKGAQFVLALEKGLGKAFPGLRAIAVPGGNRAPPLLRLTIEDAEQTAGGPPRHVVELTFDNHRPLQNTKWLLDQVRNDARFRPLFTEVRRFVDSNDLGRTWVSPDDKRSGKRLGLCSYGWKLLVAWFLMRLPMHPQLLPEEGPTACKQSSMLSDFLYYMNGFDWSSNCIVFSPGPDAFFLPGLAPDDIDGDKLEKSSLKRVKLGRLQRKYSRTESEASSGTESEDRPLKEEALMLLDPFDPSHNLLTNVSQWGDTPASAVQEWRAALALGLRRPSGEDGTRVVTNVQSSPTRLPGPLTLAQKGKGPLGGHPVLPEQEITHNLVLRWGPEHSSEAVRHLSRDDVIEALTSSRHNSRAAGLQLLYVEVKFDPLGELLRFCVLSFGTLEAARSFKEMYDGKCVGQVWKHLQVRDSDRLGAFKVVNVSEFPNNPLGEMCMYFLGKGQFNLSPDLPSRFKGRFLETVLQALGIRNHRSKSYAAELKSMLSQNQKYGPVIFDEEGNRTDWFVHIRERLLLARPAPAAPAARRSTEDHPVLSRQKSQDVSAHGPAIEDFADFWQARLREHQSTSWRSNYDIRVSSPHGQRVMAHYLPLIEHELDRLQTAANQDHIPLGGILGDDGRAVRRGAGTRDGDFLPGQDEATAADNVASATHARNRNYVCAAENGEVPPN